MKHNDKHKEVFIKLIKVVLDFCTSKSTCNNRLCCFTCIWSIRLRGYLGNLLLRRSLKMDMKVRNLNKKEKQKGI